MGDYVNIVSVATIVGMIVMHEHRFSKSNLIDGLFHFLNHNLYNQRIYYIFVLALLTNK